MCRAIKVMCVAPDAAKLAELKRAAVGAEWELAAGATSRDDALAQIDEARAHVLVLEGDFPGLAAAARERYPGLRIVLVASGTDSDTDAGGGDAGTQEPDVVRASLDQVRSAIIGLPRPGGPVRAG